MFKRNCKIFKKSGLFEGKLINIPVLSKKLLKIQTISHDATITSSLGSKSKKKKQKIVYISMINIIFYKNLKIIIYVFIIFSKITMNCLSYSKNLKFITSKFWI